MYISEPTTANTRVGSTRFEERLARSSKREAGNAWSSVCKPESAIGADKSQRGEAPNPVACHIRAQRPSRATRLLALGLRVLPSGLEIE